MKVEDGQFAPPAILSPRSKALWISLAPRRCRSAERLTLLQTALECLDRADQARARVDTEGLTVKTLGSGTIHVHPLVKVESEARRQFAKLWAALGLTSAEIDRYRDGAWEDKPGIGLPTCLR
jgi:phage terminase small subunit